MMNVIQRINLRQCGRDRVTLDWHVMKAPEEVIVKPRIRTIKKMEEDSYRQFSSACEE